MSCLGRNLARDEALRVAKDPKLHKHSLINLLHPMHSFFIVLIEIGNAFFFFFTLTWPGATAQIVVTRNDTQTIISDDIYAFGLLNSVQEMWDSQAYALAVLIAAFTGFSCFLSFFFFAFYIFFLYDKSLYNPQSVATSTHIFFFIFFQKKKNIICLLAY